MLEFGGITSLAQFSSMRLWHAAMCGSGWSQLHFTHVLELPTPLPHSICPTMHKAEESDHTDVCMVCGHELQNPEVVALKEDIKRTGKKLKLWERELEDRKTKLEDQHNKVAKLEQDLEQVNAGEPSYCLHLHAREKCSLASAVSAILTHTICLAPACSGQGREFSPDMSPELQIGTECSMHGSAFNSCFCWPCIAHAGYMC